MYLCFPVVCCSGRTEHSIRHHSEGLDLLIVPETYAGSDEDIVNDLARLQKPVARNQIFRVSPSANILLHRLLVQNRAEMSTMKGVQESLKTEEILLAGKGREAEANYSPNAVTVTIVVLALTIIIGKKLGIGRRFELSAWFLFGAALLGGLLSSLGAMRVMQNINVTNKLGLTNTMKVGQFSFVSSTGVNERQSSGIQLSNPYKYLAFFVNGALGLPKQEVQYGLAIDDVIGDSLFSNRTYSMYIGSDSKERFRCGWWSLTVYADDKYLVPNSEHIFSVANFNLGNKTTIVLSESRPEPDKAWIPLNKTHSSGFRLVLRLYEPNFDWVESPIQVPDIVPINN